MKCEAFLHQVGESHMLLEELHVPTIVNWLRHL
jgi:hypothetical protein